MTNTAELTATEFLLARIAEDEARANHAKWAMQGEWFTTAEDKVDEYVRALHPGRVLAECAAKRQIAEEHSNSKGECATCLEYVSIWNEDYAMKEWPCPTLRSLVAVYADHPDYRAEWRA